MTSLNPSEINGDERLQNIALSCTSSVEENVSSPSYQFTWMLNQSPIDLTDTRIVVCNFQYLLTCYHA